MTSKKYSVEELKTLLSHTHDEVQHILLNPSPNNNQQYFQNFTTISLRTIKYINHYLNNISYDQHIGSVIEGIISSMNHSLVEYRSRNVFTSSCVVSQINFDQNEEREEDEIYHFMNTRNRSIPPQCLGNPELERQRLELQEFLETMQKKKTTFKEPKKSLELPMSQTKKIKFLRKTTYDPSLTPIKEEDNNLHSLQKLPVIHDFDSRPSQQDAETQTEFTMNAQNHTPEKDQEEFKSQAESALVSEVAENTVISENKVESEVAGLPKPASNHKKKSNKRLDTKSKSKKKAKIAEVPFFSRQGSRKGIKVPDSALSSIGVSMNQCSLKLVKNPSQHLSLNSKQVDISINNIQPINISVTFSSKNRRPSEQQQDVLEASDGYLGSSITCPLKVKGDVLSEHEVQGLQSSCRLIDHIKETLEEDILEPMQHHTTITSSLERNQIQQSAGLQPKTKDITIYKSNNPSQAMTSQHLVKIQFEANQAQPNQQVENASFQNRSFTNKRLTILNMKLSGNNDMRLSGSNAVEGHLNGFNLIAQELVRKKQQLESQQYRLNNNTNSVSEEDFHDRKLFQMADREQASQVDQQNSALGSRIRKQQKMLTVYEVKNNKLPRAGQPSRDIDSMSKKLTANKAGNPNFYSTFDSFGQFGNQSSPNQPRRNNHKDGFASIGPMIKIVAQPRSETSTAHKLDLKQNRHNAQPKETIISKIPLARKSNHISPVNPNDARKLSEALARTAKKHTSFVLRNSLVKDGKQNGQLPQHIIEQKECNESDNALAQAGLVQREAKSVHYNLKGSLRPYKSLLSTVNETRKGNRAANQIKSTLNGSQHLQMSNSMSHIDLQELSRGLRHKNKREMLLQYLELMELTHHKFCGQNCTHLQQLFKKKGADQSCVDQTALDQLLRLLKRSH